MEEVKTLAMLQELSEKIDTMIDLLRNIESNTSSTESNTDDIFMQSLSYKILTLIYRKC